MGTFHPFHGQSWPSTAKPGAGSGTAAGHGPHHSERQKNPEAKAPMKRSSKRDSSKKMMKECVFQIEDVVGYIDIAYIILFNIEDILVV